MSNKVGLIAQREYVENVRTKSFWIGIFLIPVLYAVLIGGGILLEKVKDVRPYAIVDRSGWLAEAVENRAAANDWYEILRVVYKESQKGEEAVAQLPEFLRPLAAPVASADPGRLWPTAKAIAGLSLYKDDQPVQLSEEQRQKLMDWYVSLPVDDVRKLEASVKRKKFHRIDVSPDLAEPEEYLRKKLEKGPKELFAYFVFDEKPDQEGSLNRYVSNNRADTDLKEWIVRLANEAVKERRFTEQGIDPDTAHEILRPLAFEEMSLSETGEEKSVTFADKARDVAPMVFVYVLWLSILIIGQSLLTNTIEEKSNRTIEVLLSSVSPFQLMAGKVLGIAGTGFTWIATWVLFAIAGVKLVPVLFPHAVSGDVITGLTSVVLNSGFLLSFVVYFILGYLLIATILVGIGSVCNSLKEAQNLWGPVTILLILPLVAMIPIGKDPNGTIAKVLSFIPLYTPFVMMNRAAGPPAAWEYAVTTVLLLVSIALASWAAAKVFRIGILMTGKPPRLREILRWIRAPVGVVPERKED